MATAKNESLNDDTSAKSKIVDIIPVVHEGEKLILPTSLSVGRAIEVLQQKLVYDEQEVQINAVIEGFVPEGAYALFVVLKEKFGWANSVPTPGFFGSKPPTMITVWVGPNESVQVPWGRFTLPGVDGHIDSGVMPDSTGKRAVFYIGGVIKRKHEDQVKDIVERVRKQVREHSIYKGKGFRLRVRDEDGEPLAFPEPKFLMLQPQIEKELIFSAEVTDAIETSVFTIIERTDEVRKLGVPLKRGILLSGPYGTGKSMTSHAVAVKAARHGWTFIVCDRADELSEVLRIAREYGPAVVFCEDIDRVMAGGRSISMDEILNIIDGVESKSAELMVVLTTNHVENINQALLRPGRLDAVIHVSPPDAEAAERLMRLYSRGLIPADENIGEAGTLMSGNIAAVIREVVERSKLAALRLTSAGEPLKITSRALVAAAHSMRNQLDLLAEKRLDERSPQEKAASIVAEAIVKTGTVVVPFPAEDGVPSVN